MAMVTVSNVPPRAIYNAAMEQRLLLRVHLTRVREVTERYTPFTWERAMHEMDLAKWEAISAVIESICEGKTVPPS